jgi:branched-chain amino acid transport system permease protein
MSSSIATAETRSLSKSISGQMSHARLTLIGFWICLLVFSWFAEGYISNAFAYEYDVLINIGVNIILAVSLNLVNGYTGQFSLGHAGFMAVGAYAAASWSNHLDKLLWGWAGGVTSPVGANLAMLASMLFGGVLAAVAGLAVGIPSLRLRGDYLAIVTLGFGEIIRTLILNADFLGAARGLSVSGNYTNVFWTFGTAGLAVYVVLGLVNSTYGRGFLTVRDDEVAAEAMGINTTWYKVTAFVVGAFFAGVAGALYGHYKAFLTPEGFNFFKAVDIVVMVILGGMGNTTGVVLAAIVLTVLPEFLRALAHTDFVPAFQAGLESIIKVHLPPLQGLLENRLILYSILLIVLMLTRPQGLFGNLGVRRRAYFKK